jgi:Domain of unknown function (DUF4136)
MQRRHLIILGVASALVFSTGAQAKPELTVDAVPGVNFSAYKTYSWVRTNPSGGYNSVLYQRIQSDIDSKLATKGYVRADSGDITLALTLGKRQKVDIDTWGVYGFHEDVHSYTQGQVSVDAFDSRTKQALWHGQITDVVKSKQPDPERLDAALSQLIEPFPATAAASVAAEPPPAQ